MKFENERTSSGTGPAGRCRCQARAARGGGHRLWPGNLTEVLAACFPGARVTGLDSPADMVEAARKRLPELKFEVSSIETWDDLGPYDVIPANAVLQWLPRPRPPAARARRQAGARRQPGDSGAGHRWTRRRIA
ncbi:class I SAM-dependent methyltransferase [Cupriavidus basilensis]